MTILQQPPSSPNTSVSGPALASPSPECSSFRPIETPVSPIRNLSHTFVPYPRTPPLSPASPHSTYTGSSSASRSPQDTSPFSQHGRVNSSLRRQNDTDSAGIQDIFIDRYATESYRLQSAKHRKCDLADHSSDAKSKGSNRSTSGQVNTSKVGLSANRMNMRQLKQVVKEIHEDSEKDPYWTNDDNNTEGTDEGNTEGFIDRSMVESVRLQESKSRSLALLESYTAKTKSPVEEAFSRTDDQYDNQKTWRRQKLHRMASSTRKKQPLSAEDVPDSETVAGMKCQLDLDREKAAEKKALLLLDIMAMF